jgi:hypothetical protein
MSDNDSTVYLVLSRESTTSGRAALQQHRVKACAPNEHSSSSAQFIILIIIYICSHSFTNSYTVQAEENIGRHAVFIDCLLHRLMRQLQVWTVWFTLIASAIGRVQPLARRNLFLPSQQNKRTCRPLYVVHTYHLCVPMIQ